jgi:glycerol-3-phosphate dehydrogenase
VLYACVAEGALHLDDVLARRTRISIEAWDRGVAAAPVAARIMADALGWDEERIETEINTYNKRVAAELASQELPDDESADRARLEAPEIVPLETLPAAEPVGTRTTA